MEFIPVCKCTAGKKPPANNMPQRHIARLKKCSFNMTDYINNGGYNQIKYSNELSPATYQHHHHIDNNNETKAAISYHLLPNNVPINLMPPPPHNNFASVNNNNSNNNNNRGSWKSGQDLRCNSPHGSESDESCRSYGSRESPTNMQKQHRNKIENNNALISKFSISSPSIFYPPVINQNGNNYNNKPKYFANGGSWHDKKRFVSTDIKRRVHGLMERFSARSSMCRIPVNPSELMVNMNEYDMLNQSIWDVYQAKAQKEGTYMKKLELWKMVYMSIHNILIRYGLFLVGSTMSGLGLDSSDIDMCLLVRPCLADARSDALSYLQSICSILENCAYIKSAEVIMAKVPILKFRDSLYGFEVDLNCNNSVGIQNTHLMNCYARLDWRVRPLVAIVKLWAQANNINDAKRMTISSYSLALMVIHFLQCGVTPPAIPCLQGMYPHKFRPDLEIKYIDIQDEEIPAFRSDNKQSLGELLIGFLRYYTFFNYDQFAISVREGALLSKEECRYTRAPKNDATQWKLLCIEEPFDLTNTARSVYDVDTFEHIKRVFGLSYEALYETKNLSSVLAPGQR